MNGPLTNQMETVLASHMKQIDHVAIAVIDLESAVRFYEKIGFITVDRLLTQGEYSSMKSAVMMCGKVKFVLLQGLDEDSQITRFIKNAAPGPQHIALEVVEIEKLYEAMKNLGVEFETKLIQSPTLKQAFTRRCKNTGMMIEIIERSEYDGFESKNVDELFKQLESSKNF